MRIVLPTPKTILTASILAVVGCGGSDSPTTPDVPVTPPAPAPTVTGVSANSGSLAGGITVTISGTAFVSVPTVTFGGTNATGVVFQSSTSLTATVPAHAAGSVAVVVTNPDNKSGSLSNAFTYLAAPTVSGVAPDSGPSSGGTAVTISGTAFVTGATVTVGGTAATSVTVTSATSITATTPAHAAGAVDVVVTNPDAQSGTLDNAFTYVAAPSVINVSPALGPSAGGTSITIAGTGFAAGATVTVGGTAATGVTVASATSITATTPAHAAGAVDVVVTNPDAQSGTLANAFTYASGPTVTSVTPNSSTMAGGIQVTITGTGFVAVPSITFGGTAATGIAFQSSTSLLATVPAHAAGAVDVVVTNPDAQSGTLPGGFTYVPPPTVTGITPAVGPLTGGTAVTITGTAFLSGATVTIGGTAASNVTVSSATSLTATTPAHAAGAVSIVVTNPDTQSGTLANAFTYVSGPTVTSVTPNTGFAIGGSLVTITGTGFVAIPTVTFGGTAATGVAFQSSTTLIVTTPAHAAGSVDVVVTNPDTQTGTLTDGYTFVAAPTVTSAEHTPNQDQTPLPDPKHPDFPFQISSKGDNLITIVGTGFNSETTVSLGGTAIAFPTLVDANTITFITPAHAAGPVDVVVTNADGQTGTLAGPLTYVDATALANDGGEYTVDLAFQGGSFKITVQLASVPGTDRVTGQLQDAGHDNYVTEVSGEILGDFFFARFRMSANTSLNRDRGEYTCSGRIGSIPFNPQSIGVANVPEGASAGTFTSPTPDLLGAPAGTPAPLTGSCTLRSNPT